MTNRPDSFGATDIGRLRKVNEDHFLIAELAKGMEIQQTSLGIRESTRLTSVRSGFLYLVADGMGGAPAGERASHLAVESVVRYVLNVMSWCFRVEHRDELLEQELKKVLEKCQTTLEADIAENPSRFGMGTTLTMAYVIWPELYVVHVGDARAYLFRGRHLHQITQDHTISKALGTGSVAPHIRKVLWNVIGGGTPELEPDVYHLTLEPKDELLLATDGLIRHLSDERIAATLGTASSARTACTRLISEACSEGGRDNITTIVARFNGALSASDTSAIAARELSTLVLQPLPLPESHEPSRP
jgi:serine/threonine protein phosphatase PrpC